jgi:GDP-L-fucose synthase
MKVLVTGGYGLVGKSLQKIVKSKDNLIDEFVFLSRQDCDLRNIQDVYNIFEKIRPDVVIHLASCVGGVYENMLNNYNYLLDNSRLNLNIIDACNKYKIKRLINILSTCIFPDKDIVYPLTSDQLHNGLPHNSNIGYAYSKRILHLTSELLANKSENFKVINLTPTNLYGCNDNYNLERSHVIPGLIHKTYNCKKENTPLKINGSGKALRQFVNVNDLSRIIYKFIYLDISDNSISVVVSPPESDEISISELVNEICKCFDYYNFYYDSSFSDGQLKKTASNSELLKYLPDFKFTPLNVGLKETIDFFIENYNSVRK